MGKRRGGSGGGSGGGKKQSNSDRILRRHIIEAAGKNYSSVEQVVDHLRSSYPHYARLKLRPFTKQVERVTMAEDSNDGGDTPIAIKRRKVDNKEEKLQLISGGGCSSSASAISSGGGGGSSDEETSSTSDDAIKGEPKFDLMKSMVRENLHRKSKKLGEGRAVNCKEAVELEGVDSEGMKKEVTLMNGESKLGDKNLNENYWNRSSGKDGNVIDDKTMFKDLGGMSRVIEELKLDVIVPLLHPQVMPRLGVKPTAGILLHGPPGCGKSKLARAIANETGVPFYKISAPDVVSGVSGESEENIRELFSKAYRTAPSIVLIEEIDAIASKRDNMGREMEKRIVTQLLTSMDESHVPVKPVGDDAAPGSSDCRPVYVLVIGTTNRPDALDPALRRPGRFDREIALGVPDEAARIEILSVLIRKVRVEGDLDIRKIARLTPGFAGADLTALASMAARFAIKRILDAKEVELSKEEKDGEHSEEWLRRPWWDEEIKNLSMELLRRPWSDEEIENLSITMADFEDAAKKVQPSTRREGFSDIPDVTWDDVGGLHLLRQEFDRFIVRRIKFPEKYEKFGKRSATGFLLYGPPGCGKTLIAKAVANEAGANFIHIKGPELMNKYVGESELAVRTIFSRARTCSPCILFFDELDALTGKHGQDEGGCAERVLKQLLIELDGAEQRRGVYVIGATNRPKVMDDALLRPGRFGKLMYVPLPTPDERGMILKALAREMPIDADVDLIALGKGTRCHNLSGADLSALMDEAHVAAVDDDFSSTDTSCSLPRTIKDAHFTSALENISPSVSDEQIRYYESLSKSFNAGKRRA